MCSPFMRFIDDDHDASRRASGACSIWRMILRPGTSRACRRSRGSLACPAISMYGMAAQLVPALQEAAVHTAPSPSKAIWPTKTMGWAWVQAERACGRPAVAMLRPQQTSRSSAAAIDPRRRSPARRPRDPFAGAGASCPPNAVGFDSRGPALIAWDGSPEAARASAAMPLLERASSVTFATVQRNRNAVTTSHRQTAPNIFRVMGSRRDRRVPRPSSRSPTSWPDAAMVRDAACSVMRSTAAQDDRDDLWRGDTGHPGLSAGAASILACHCDAETGRLPMSATAPI